MMLFNLGSAYCLRSEYEKARKCLHQLKSMCSTHRLKHPAGPADHQTEPAAALAGPEGLPDSRKKPVQPIQLPSSFTQVQRK
ncbi:hypothetical protein KUCAC02_014613 [Chaenocephalus aceratus]|uniref:Uncharacterized protein n=1 Tax=Chaenocephalus aceratus TaxID=36190 RepID=A0ACB9WFC3_CHAAC|nr:hypothetical protein KUCAC02_014613 [Chaenocephalus aceratus]